MPETFSRIFVEERLTSSLMGRLCEALSAPLTSLLLRALAVSEVGLATCGLLSIDDVSVNLSKALPFLGWQIVFILYAFCPNAHIYI